MTYRYWRERYGYYGCWTKVARAHPWDPAVTDMPCGYHDRLHDARCEGCWRQRP